MQGSGAVGGGGNGGGNGGRCYSESHHRHRTPGQILSLTSTLAFSVAKRKRFQNVANAGATPPNLGIGANRSVSDSGEFSLCHSQKEKQVGSGKGFCCRLDGFFVHRFFVNRLLL